MIKTPKMPFFLMGRGRRCAGSLLDLLQAVSLLLNLLIVVHFYPIIPLVQALGKRKEVHVWEWVPLELLF